MCGVAAMEHSNVPGLTAAPWLWSRYEWLQCVNVEPPQQLLFFTFLLSSCASRSSWWAESWMKLLCDGFKAGCCSPLGTSSLFGVNLNHPEDGTDLWWRGTDVKLGRGYGTYPYLTSGTLCVLSERLLILLELPPLLCLSPTSRSLSLTPLLELRLEVRLSRCSLTEASDREQCGWVSWLLTVVVPWLVTVGAAEAFASAAPVLVPMDLEITLSLWELGL